jgi:hypothetical protein
MVMSPRNFKPGHFSTISRHRSTVSWPGSQPLLASSPEVLTWTWTPSLAISGLAAMAATRALLSRCAFLDESTLETQKRLGMRARCLQWVDCRPPMKCQLMEDGRSAAFWESS